MNKILIANAMFSAMCGLLMWLFKDWLATQFPGPVWLWPMLSLGLVLFASQLVYVVTRKKVTRAWLQQIIASDFLWVVASSGLRVWFSSGISSTGTTLVIVTNLIVGLFAVLQTMAYRQTPLHQV